MSGAINDTDDEPMPDSLPDLDIVSGEAPDDLTGEWLTIPEAVARTGRTERSVRRDVAARVYPVRQVKGRTQLWFPIESGTMPDSNLAIRASGIVPDTSLAIVAGLNELTAQYLAAIDARDATIRELEREAERLRGELSAATVKPDTVRQVWWRRWFGH